MGNKTRWALLVAALVPTFIVAGFWQHEHAALNGTRSRLNSSELGAIATSTSSQRTTRPSSR